MKIVAFSDAHWLYPQLSIPECDLLIYAGDWCSGNDMQNTTRFVSWLAKQKAKNKVVIPGNHDIIAQENPKFVEGVFNNFGIKYLCDSSTTIDGIKIYGTPWVPQFFNWAFMGDELELASRFAEIPKDTDILVTHGPAYGILDLVNYSLHAGSTALADRINKLRVPIHICGHIHCGFGKMESKYTHYYNVAVLDDDYKLVNKPTEIIL